MDYIDEIMNEYSIGDIVQTRELTQGNTSNARLIVTPNGKFILRKLKDTKQAMTEFTISNELLTYRISSEILLTNNNVPYVKRNNEVYNLQRYIEHDVPKQEIDFETLGNVIATFHSSVQHIEGIYEQDDRFSLPVMWQECKSRSIEENKDLTDLVEQCLAYKHEENCYIHGDLGKWNLLFSEQNIYVIDFGEVRKGNNHFDIAAVLTSTIDWKLEDASIIDSFINFKKGYDAVFEEIDWTLLRENINSWFVRGIVALLINTEQADNYVKTLLSRRERLDNIFIKKARCKSHE
jgi:thiamine kinase-like enzyme